MFSSNSFIPVVLILVNNVILNQTNAIKVQKFERNFTSNSRLSDKISKLVAPEVGAFRKNFKGEIIKTITTVSNSETSLPELRYEDYLWEGISIELECNASYPVKWVYSGVGAPPVHSNTFRIATNFFDETSYTFRASITFTHTASVATGNYTCQSVDNPELHSYLYVFVPGKGIFMADAEETEIIVADFDSPWVTLPCSVADPDAKVILLKKHSKGGLEVLRLGSHITYDPKIGFQLQWRLVHQPWADYVCIATTDENNEQLDITLMKPEPPGTKPLDTLSSSASEEETLDVAKKIPKRGVRFIQDSRNNRIVCCSSTNERPILKSTGCSSVSDCELRLPYLRAKKCPPVCEHVVNIGRTCVGYELAEWKDNGMLQCTLPGSTIQETYMFSKDDDSLFYEFNQSQQPKEQILKLYSEKSPKKGKLYVSCHANPFFFSHGLKWAWKRPNGKLEMIDGFHYPAPTNIEIDRDSNIGSSIYCFAPTWNSASEWKSESIVIK